MMTDNPSLTDCKYTSEVTGSIGEGKLFGLLVEMLNIALRCDPSSDMGYPFAN